jgi:hypothetical protein
MLLDVLGRSLDITVYNEDHPSAFRAFRLRDQATCQKLIAGSYSKWVVFKPLLDSQLAPQLLSDYPHSRAIWIYRHYQDVANSAVQLWGDWFQVAIRRLVTEPTWEYYLNEGLTPSLRQVVEDLYDEQISAHTASALFWYMRNALYFELCLDQYPSQIHLVRYEHLVSEPIREFGKLFAWLEISFRPSWVKGIFASSVAKQPFPEIDRRVQELCEDLEARLDAALRREA